MFINLDFEKFIFFDIETVPEYATLDELKKANSVKYDYWMNKRYLMIKNKYKIVDDDPKETYIKFASIYPEFNKIISVAFSTAGEYTEPQVISFSGKNEKQLLMNVSETISSFTDLEKFPHTILWGFYSNRFDVPVMYKRFLVNSIEMPISMYFHQIKPWEGRFKDVYDIWNVLNGEKVSSLGILANVLDIPTSKDDISGEDVYNVYYKEDNIERIAAYCEKDTILTLNILKRISNLPIVDYDEFDIERKII